MLQAPPCKASLLACLRHQLCTSMYTQDHSAICQTLLNAKYCALPHQGERPLRQSCCASNACCGSTQGACCSAQRFQAHKPLGGEGINHKAHLGILSQCVLCAGLSGQGWHFGFSAAQILPECAAMARTGHTSRVSCPSPDAKLTPQLMISIPGASKYAEYFLLTGGN